MMSGSWLYWSDHLPLYLFACFGLMALLGILVVWPVAINKTGWLGTAFFVLILCAFVVLARWPGLFYPRGFNPDEDQLVAALRAESVARLGAVLPGVFFGHDKIPEIQDFVAANYILFEGNDGVRIYKWKEVRH
jgi:hypothetical protein